MNLPSRQRGVALLAAILLVALATILAAAIAFQSAMAARRGIANLSFDVSVLVAQGAEALAAYGLRQDTNDTDDFTDVWAQPVGPIEITPGVMLTATLEDLQGRFNLNSLVRNDGKSGIVDKDAVELLRNILQRLELEEHWADKIADWIDRNDTPDDSQGMEDNGTTTQVPPYRVANTYITSTSELLALPGFGRERYLKLAPFVVALPPDAGINLCSASGLLLDALQGPTVVSYTKSERLQEDRKKECDPPVDRFKREIENPSPTLADRVTDDSLYFRLTSLVTIGDAEFTLYSLIRRDPKNGSTPGGIRVLQRSFTPD